MALAWLCHGFGTVNSGIITLYIALELPLSIPWKREKIGKKWKKTVIYALRDNRFRKLAVVIQITKVWQSKMEYSRLRACWAT